MIKDKGRDADYFFVDYNLQLYSLIFRFAGIEHKLTYDGKPFELSQDDIRAIDVAQQRISNIANAIATGNKNAML